MPIGERVWMRVVVVVGLVSAGLAGTGVAQQQAAPVPVPAQAPAAVPAPPVPADGAPVQAAPARSTAAPALPADGDPPKQPAAPVAPAATPTPAPAVPPKKGKEPYNGPTAVVQLAPTPMLDEEGRQRLDPDGKPMFNPPVQQQRDKKGHPVFDDKGQPVFQSKDDLGYDENGKKLHADKEPKAKKVAVSIEHGTLTVDGMTGKAGLNYEIADFKYIYLYAPWVGLTVVSNEPFPGAIEQKEAFRDNTLTVTAGEHTYQLYSDKKLLGKKPESAFVLVDRNFSMPVRFPVVGYGVTRKAPYDFPGSKQEVASKGAKAPPLPESVRPATALAACPRGRCGRRRCRDSRRWLVLRSKRRKWRSTSRRLGGLC